MIDLNKIEWSAKEAQTESRAHPMWPQRFLCTADELLELIRLVREYEREHKHDCIREIGKRAGYWDCDCEP